MRVHVSNSVQHKGHQMACSYHHEEQDNDSKLVFVVFGLNITIYLLQVLFQVVDF